MEKEKIELNSEFCEVLRLLTGLELKTLLLCMFKANADNIVFLNDFTIKQFADKFQCSNSGVRNSIHTLKKKGVLKSIGSCTYKLKQ
jgi:predicted DNA-binding protein YlxM (UPF0122 family)